MTSLILENADLNRLFPKCRPRGVGPDQLADDNIINNNNRINNNNTTSRSSSYERDELEEEEEGQVASRTTGRLELIGGTHETCNPTGRYDHRHHPRSNAPVCSVSRVETTDNDVDMIDLERDTSDR